MRTVKLNIGKLFLLTLLSYFFLKQVTQADFFIGVILDNCNKLPVHYSTSAINVAKHQNKFFMENVKLR
jgi:hypothetical protein